MYPIIHIGSISVSSYYLFAVLAGLSGFILSVCSLRKQFGKRRSAVILPLLLVVSALLGARLLNAILNPEAYPDMASVFELQYKKMSLMGGLFLGFIVVLASALITKTSPGVLGDRLTFPAFVGIVLLKIGCFLNGCCFGKPAKAPFGMVFPANKVKYQFINWLPIVKPTSEYVYPTQLFEIGGAIIALLIALAVRKVLKHRPGVFAAAFGALFSLARLVIMPFRLWAYPDTVIHLLYPAFYILLISLGVGYILLTSIFSKSKYRKLPKT